ncbi:CstA-like transporter-associated (seleno)protein [Streptomyces sp. NPDC054796]
MIWPRRRGASGSSGAGRSHGSGAYEPPHAPGAATPSVPGARSSASRTGRKRREGREERGTGRRTGGGLGRRAGRESRTTRVPGAAPRLPAGAGVRARLRHTVAWTLWYVRELNGEHAYERYAARARAEDPHARVLTRGEFERRRTDRRDADPREGGHCC